MPQQHQACGEDMRSVCALYDTLNFVLLQVLPQEGGVDLFLELLGTCTLSHKIIVFQLFFLVFFKIHMTEM